MNWSSGFSGAGSVFVPIWCMLLPVSIPTYILWRRDRRKPEGCGKECGYDLTGNESGVCSECGTEIEQPSPIRNEERKESGVVAGRGEFREQQINAIMRR